MTDLRAHFADSLFNAKVDLLGVNQPLDLANDQTSRVYLGEKGWVKGAPDGTHAQTISAASTRDLAGEAIFHPAMDDVPGIEKVRASFDPAKNVKFLNSETMAKAGLSPTWLGASGSNGNLYFRGDALPRVGTVTHEVAHRLTLSAEDETGMRFKHQWPMARLHIHTVRTMLGDKHADALRGYYESAGADFGNKPI
jgi:hypothetical protein